LVTNINNTNITSSSALLTNVVNTNLTSASALVTNIVNTNMTTTSLSATNITAAGALVTNLSSTSATIANVRATNVTSSSLYVNSVKMTPSLGDILSEGVFVAANNVSTATNVTGLAFANAVVRAFNALVAVEIIRSAGGSRYANFQLRGINKEGTWTMNSAFIGDNNTGITFTITSAGQVQYTSTNISNYTSSALKFKADTLSV
jgi:hypothetical protein